MAENTGVRSWEKRQDQLRKEGKSSQRAGAIWGTRGKVTPFLDDICRGLGGGTVESAAAPSAGADRAQLSPSKFLPSGKRRLFVWPSPRSGPQRLERGSRNAHPDPYPLGWPGLARTFHPWSWGTSHWGPGLSPQPQPGTGRELSSAGKNPQRIRNPHRMGIERAETPGVPPQTRHPGTQASAHHSHPFGEPGPPHLERSQARLRKGNFISINTR